MPRLLHFYFSSIFFVFTLQKWSFDVENLVSCIKLSLSLLIVSMIINEIYMHKILSTQSAENYKIACHINFRILEVHSEVVL